MSEIQPLTMVSSCLIGLCTRYNAQLKTSESCLAHLRHLPYIPFCPEQLGGLPTPREPADIVGGDGHDVLAGNAKVMTKSGVDVTSAFIKGANQVLYLAKNQPISTICLKSRSPSCAVTEKTGVTAALLQQHGYQLLEF